MFSNFGHKWVCLQTGPGFAYSALEEERVNEESCEVEVHGTNTVTDASSDSILQQAWQQVFGDDGYTSPDTALDPFDASNQEPLNVKISIPPDGRTNDKNTFTASQDVSFLWARLSVQDKEQVVEGDNPTEIEEIHGVRPQPRQSLQKHCDPMKAKVNVTGQFNGTSRLQLSQGTLMYRFVEVNFFFHFYFFFNLFVGEMSY